MLREARGVGDRVTDHVMNDVRALSSELAGHTAGAPVERSERDVQRVETETELL